jgi:hypothetical protein
MNMNESIIKTARQPLTPEERVSNPFLQQMDADRKSGELPQRLKVAGEQIAKNVTEEDILTNNLDPMWIENKAKLCPYRAILAQMVDGDKLI